MLERELGADGTADAVAQPGDAAADAVAARSLVEHKQLKVRTARGVFVSLWAMEGGFVSGGAGDRVDAIR